MYQTNVPERVNALSEKSPESAVAKFMESIRKWRSFLIFHVIPNGPTKHKSKTQFGNIIQIGYRLLNTKLQTIEEKCVCIYTHPYVLSELTSQQTGITNEKMEIQWVSFLEAFVDLSEVLISNNAILMSFGVASLRYLEAAMELCHASFPNGSRWKRDWIDIELITGSVLEPELSLEQALRHMGIKPAWMFQDASAAVENSSALLSAIFGNWLHDYEQRTSSMPWPLLPEPPKATWFQRNFENIIQH